MNTAEILEYFASKGNPVGEVITGNPEVLALFLKQVGADYACLEGYPASSLKITSPLHVFGGALDEGVPDAMLRAWDQHATTPPTVTVFQAGHFFLQETNHNEVLGDIILKTIADIAAAVQAEQDAAEIKAGFEIEDIVKDAYATVLQLDEVATRGLQSDSNFDDLGGSSLDSISLAVLLKIKTGTHLSQNEFLLHPTVAMLAR